MNTKLIEEKKILLNHRRHFCFFLSFFLFYLFINVFFFALLFKKKKKGEFSLLLIRCICGGENLFQTFCTNYLCVYGYLCNLFLIYLFFFSFSSIFFLLKKQSTNKMIVMTKIVYLSYNIRNGIRLTFGGELFSKLLRIGINNLNKNYITMN